MHGMHVVRALHALHVLRALYAPQALYVLHALHTLRVLPVLHTPCARAKCTVHFVPAGHELPASRVLRDTNCLQAAFVHAEHTQATPCHVFVHVKTCTGNALPPSYVRTCEPCAGQVLTVVVHVVHVLVYHLCSCM
jgi:hypothetical protein